nr:adenylate/guanylate cyclase domain-containing protein [Roseibium hamelinense]
MPKKFFITPTLTTVLGLFVLVTAGAVFLVQALTSQEVVRQLGGELVDVGMEALETAFIEQLYAVTEAAEYTALALEKGSVRQDDAQAMKAYLFGALAPMEHVSFVLAASPSGRSILVNRGDADGTLSAQTIDIPADDALVKPLFDRAGTETAPFWSDPLYIPDREHTYMVYVKPRHENGAYAGSVMVGMSLYRMSEVTWNVSDDELTVFLMRENSTDIVAHPDLEEKFDDLGTHQTLIGVEQVPDPFLAGFHDLQQIDNGLYDISDRDRLFAGYDDFGDKRFLIIEDYNENFFGLPVRIGVHFPADYLDHPIQALIGAAIIGAGLLLASLAGAGILAQRIARPIQRASAASTHVANLSLGNVAPLPPSSIRELDDLASGFNAMVGGLKAFNRYLPKTLVMKLLSEGRSDAPPEERIVAVLFTDIAGFTSTSEGMTAGETASFVNHHLSLLGAEIRKQNGTIDKYIGDSVMAFWGAPETLDNPAEPAARAALGMAAAIHQDNEKRRAAGQDPVRVRIGLHIGPLVVGDIGAPERVNYTVIGDTVNVASRLESLGKEIDDTAETIIIVSSDIADKLPDDVARVSIGPRKVKGKDVPVEAFRLSSGHEARDEAAKAGKHP